MMRSMKKGLGMAGLNFVGKCQPVFHILGSVDQQRGCCEVALMESMRSHCILPAVM